MSANEIQILVASITGLLVVLGGGTKWILSHIDAIQTKSAIAEAQARTELSKRLHEEIHVLRMELDKMQAEKRLYLRRIAKLEEFIHAQPDIEIPTMTGWPPL